MIELVIEDPGAGPVDVRLRGIDEGRDIHRFLGVRQDLGNPPSLGLVSSFVEGLKTQPKLSPAGDKADPILPPVEDLLEALQSALRRSTGAAATAGFGGAGLESSSGGQTTGRLHESAAVPAATTPYAPEPGASAVQVEEIGIHSVLSTQLRLLIVESGADVRYVGTACPRTPWSDPDREWLESRGVRVNYRASLEDDCAAMEAIRPDLAIGTTPVVQKAKEHAIPSLYFTNLISARPLMGPAGAGSLAQVVNAALSNRERFDRMRDFFEGVGEGDKAGVWEAVPVEKVEFREGYQQQLERQSLALHRHGLQ